MDFRQKLPDRRDLLVLALLCLLPVMAFSALLFSGKTLYRGDLTKVWYPLAVFKARLLSSGQLPLWNPYIQFGFPQLADQDVLALHPLNLLFLLPVNPHVALSYFVVAHFVLAGIFGYMLARSLQMSRVGALITALTFALSGYLMAQLTNLPIMTGSVWLPLILFLFIKTLDRKSPVHAILCGGVIGLQILASHPQVVFYSLLTLGAYGVFRLIQLWRDDGTAAQEKRKETGALLLLMSVPIVSGLALAAVQIIPTWELKGLSPRATGLSYGMMTLWSLPPYGLLTFLFPMILGNPLLGYKGEGVFEELHAYVGILPLMLALWAWSKRPRDSHVVFFTILAGASLLLALGRHTPLYQLLVHVPGFNFFRVPPRWLFIISLSLAVLAGYGFDALAGTDEREDSRRFAIFWRALWWLNLGVTIMLLAGLIFGQQAVQAINNLRAGLLSEHAIGRTVILIQELTRLPLIQPADNLALALSSLNPALLFLLLSNAAFLLIYLWNKRRISATSFQVMVVSLIVVDLLLTGGTIVNPVRDASYYEHEIESTAFLRQNAGLHRIFPFVEKDYVYNILEDIPTIYDLYSVRGQMSELTLQRYRTFIDKLGQSAALMNLAGVKYALVEEDSGYPGWIRVFAGGGVAIYENESVLPRAFIVHHAEVISSEQAVLERLLSDDFDPSATVILEEEPPLGLDQVSPPSEPDLRGAGIALYSPHRVVIEADLKADGFLVLSDAYYPGWKVSVDGQENRIYQADYLFRAVPLDQGRHVLEFRYRPLSFSIGLSISLVTAVILSGLVVYISVVRRWKRR